MKLYILQSHRYKSDDMDLKQEGAEAHPFFPSGEWEGFYQYSPKSGKHRMECHLHFCEQVVTGYGSDDVGAFGWKGTYDTEAGTCHLTKQYIGSHAVHYEGHADENGIWGTWHIGSSFSGGFHLWPKRQVEESESVATADEEIAQIGA